MSTQTKVPVQKYYRLVNSLQEAVKRYGPIINGKWVNENQWMEIYTTPEWFKNQVIGPTGQPCSRIYMNKDMIPVFNAALEQVKARGLEKELKSFDGCFNIREIRGVPGSVSSHSYGCSFDVNAAENPLGQEPKLSSELVACFTDVGFTWGGTWQRPDGMHFEFWIN